MANRNEFSKRTSNNEDFYKMKKLKNIIMLKLEKVSRFKKQKPPNKSCKTLIPQSRPEASTRYPTFQQQFDPAFIYGHFLQQQSTHFLEQWNQAHYHQRQFQDSILTMFIDRKIVLVQYTMMSFAVVSIFLSIFGKKLEQIDQQILIVHSVITFGMVAMLALRYFFKEELKRKQLLRQKIQNKLTKLLKQTVIQLLVLLMHPNLLAHGQSLPVSQPISNQTIQLHLNTVFQILMQLRIYLVFLSIISSSIYCNTRANRLCRIYSTKNNIFFGIKALFEYKPLTFLILLYISMVLSLGQMISLSEREYQQDFWIFENSVWFVIITMGTVGYGDYSPKTYLGRIISFSAAISGIIISSLLILTLSRYLSMSTGQNKSHVTLKRLQLRRILQKYSKQTINFTTRMMFQQKIKSQTEDSQKNKKMMEELKKKTEKVKFVIRRIKNTVDTDNLKQQINRLFEALSQSLNIIYKFQQEYSQLLMQLYRKEKDLIDEIQFSFTTEIQNIIKDR